MPVDPAGPLLQRCADLAVGSDIAAAERGNLQQGDLAEVVGIVTEKLLERPEACRQSLGVVQPVDTHDELAAHQAVNHPLHRLLGRGQVGLAHHAVHVNADRVGTRFHASTVQLQTAIVVDVLHGRIQAAHE